MTMDLDNPPDEARPYVELYERMKHDRDCLSAGLTELRQGYDNVCAENGRLRQVSFLEQYEQMKEERDGFRRDRNEVQVERATNAPNLRAAIELATTWASLGDPRATTTTSSRSSTV